MNPLNYPTLPACQRLAAKGIVLETEAVWGFRDGIWSLFLREGIELEEVEQWLPAPTLAEVLRELPESKILVDLILEFDSSLAEGYAIAILVADYLRDIEKMINLLIWVRGRKERRGYELRQ